MTNKFQKYDGRYLSALYRAEKDPNQQRVLAKHEMKELKEELKRRGSKVVGVKHRDNNPLKAYGVPSVKELLRGGW